MDKNGAPEKQSVIQPILGVLAALGALLAYIVVLAIVTAAFTIGAVRAGTAEAGKLPADLATLSGIVGNVVAVALLTVALLIIKRKIAPTLALKRFSPVAAVLCIALGAAANFFSECAIALIPFPESVIDTYKELYSYLGTGSTVLEVIGVVIITPIAEEIFFRGVAYRLMRKKCSVALCVILSSVLFGLAHGNVLSFVYTVPLGVLLAVSFEASGSIFVPILIHASFNGASYLVERVLKDPSDGTLAAVCAASGALAALSLFALIKVSKKYKSPHSLQSGTERSERYETV